MSDNRLEEFQFENDAQFRCGVTTGDYKFVGNIEKCLIKGLSQMNIFVGANNSGKSRIIRKIFSQKEISINNLKSRFNIIFEKCTELKTKYKKYDNDMSIACLHFNQLNELVNKNDTSINSDQIAKLGSVKAKFEQLHRGISSKGSNPYGYAQNVLVEDFKAIVNLLSNLFVSVSLNQRLDRKYIPTLRGLRTLGEGDTNFIRTKKDYFNGKSHVVGEMLVTGHLFYSQMRAKLLGKKSERRLIAKYEKFLSKNFFEGAEVNLVPREGKDDQGSKIDVLYLTIEGPENERAIYSFGDGLQTIICLTYPIFEWEEENQDKDKALLLFIEEPEVYLHPAMQRILVEVMLSEKFSKVQYFLTTHSNHFLDLVDNYKYKNKISIFSVHENNDGVREVNSLKDRTTAVYDLLGAMPSSMVLANKTIWVEGISDVIYLRRGIELYYQDGPGTSESSKGLPISEFDDYAFVEYGGSNLQHYVDDEGDYNLRINSISSLKNVFLLVDDDGVEEGDLKLQRYKQLEAKVGDLKKTDGREIENYIKPEILKALFETEEGFQYVDYKDKKLPQFLLSKKASRYVSEDKYTKSKRDIAVEVIKRQKTWEDLVQDFQSLIEEIVNFIK